MCLVEIHCSSDVTIIEITLLRLTFRGVGVHGDPGVRIAQPMMSERFLVVFFLDSSTLWRCFTMFPGLLPTNAVVPIGNALLVYDPDQIHNYLAGAQLCKN